jgi:AraC family transcriptional regulator, regulatory protein of adaptative response / methylated-DNA-[protein]-cysteine methyltransferase
MSTSAIVERRSASDRSNSQRDAVAAARRYLDAHKGERTTLRALSRAVAMSPFHLQREFKRRFGVSPSEYARARRNTRFRDLLRNQETVSRATYEAGFGSSSRVYENAARELGMTPAAYRRGALGVRIRYTIVRSPLGHLLVAVTGRGVCAVKLGNEPKQLSEALHDEFPRAKIDRVSSGDEWLSELVERVATHLPKGEYDATIPFDVVGTSFQRRVWRALQQIPPGETRSYSEVARRIRHPKAVRAVAQACAANRIAVVVPCHRVVREDGTLGGYRWGVDVKARLLEAESAEKK